jgi:hypothetical protein
MARARLFARTSPTASPFARIELTAPVTIRLIVPSVVSACVPFRTWLEGALQSQHVCLVVGPETNELDSFDSKALRIKRVSYIWLRGSFG